MIRGILERIKKEESFMSKPYLCTAGKTTIGYGTNLDAGISERTAERLLKEKVRQDIAWLCNKSSNLTFNFRKLPYPVREVLVDMTYNIGRTGLKRFKKMNKAIAEGDYYTASKELLNSRYAKQVPARSKRNAKLLKNIRK